MPTAEHHPKGPSRRGPFLTKCAKAIGALVAIAFLTAYTGCQQGPPQPELKVSCAASLSKAVQQTAEAEELAMVLNSGGSNALARQALLGAATDLLLLAGDRMARDSLLPKGYRLTAVASNRLVLIAPVSDASPPFGTDFVQAVTATGEGRLAVADPKTAPLGAYTEQALDGLGLSSRLVPMPDAQAVLSAVALAHLTRGIVYRSDAMSNSKVRVICEIPADLHDPVIYVAAIAPDAPPDSQRLVDSLVAGRGAAILTGLGFLPVPKPQNRATPGRSAAKLSKPQKR